MSRLLFGILMEAATRNCASFIAPGRTILLTVLSVGQSNGSLAMHRIDSMQSHLYYSSVRRYRRAMEKDNKKKRDKKKKEFTELARVPLRPFYSALTLLALG